MFYISMPHISKTRFDIFIESYMQGGKSIQDASRQGQLVLIDEQIKEIPFLVYHNSVLMLNWLEITSGSLISLGFRTIPTSVYGG